jgi:hypothetical protein
MLEAILHVLPISVAVALSSVPILATIVILLSPKRAQSSVPFLIGWVLGMLVVVVFFMLTAQAVPTPRSPRRPDTVIGTLEIIVGAAIAAIAVLEWIRARRHPSTTMPKWLEAVDSFGPWSAFGVALLLNVRPKALLLAIAAALALRGDGLTPGDSVLPIAVYTVIGASTVAAPIILTLAAPERMAPRLVAMKDWVSRNMKSVTAVILLLIGLAIIWTGVARF